MKKSHQLLSICVLSCSMVFAQEGRSFPPRGAAGQSAESAADQARRGIEKKDIRRVLIAYPEGAYNSGQIQLIEAEVRQLVDAIAGGAKLTKADAARTAGPSPELASTAETLRQDLSAGRLGVVDLFVPSSVSPGAAVSCPPKGYESCSVCSRSIFLCVCAKCKDDTWVISIGWKRQGGSRSTMDGALLVTAAPPEVPQEARARLLQAGLNELSAMPESPSLVIKTKSVPQ